MYVGKYTINRPNGSYDRYTDPVSHAIFKALGQSPAVSRTPSMGPSAAPSLGVPSGPPSAVPSARGTGSARGK